MTTAQESPNGHHVVPPPCSVQNPPELNRADLPTGKANNIPNPSYVHIDTNQLPDRCQFTFSDGRQCTMARSDIHPSLCRFHSEREDQLFGDPSPGGYVVGRALDLPELYSACRDLTTAAGVNRALAQVFRLLAQRRISRQEAATFGHLAQLLLRTISAMRQENLTSRLESQQVEQPRNGIVERQKEVALSCANKVTDPTRIGVLSDEPQRRTSHVQSPANKRSHPATIVVPREHREPGDLSVSSPVKSVHSWAPPAAAPAASLSSQASQNEDLRNSPVQLAHNEHMRKVVT